MDVLITLAAIFVILLVLLDGFEAMVLPRRVAHAFRFSRLYYTWTWPAWRFLSNLIPLGRYRHSFLGFYGPLSLLGLLATWVLLLITSFGAMQWALGVPLYGGEAGTELYTYFYLSGVTFFTLGYGEITPRGTLGRALAVLEAGGGFGFLAVLIGYLPVLYQAFSRREVTISLLDARAGSPPSAGEFLTRITQSGSYGAVVSYLAEWERWSAELLESHLSFPVLSFYRSQHDNQSWLAALTFFLDTSAVIVAASKGPETYQAQLTFAMARHAAVDLGLSFQQPPRNPVRERMSETRRLALRAELEKAGYPLKGRPEVEAKLQELRDLYEPYVIALAEYFAFTLPPYWPDKVVVDNWQTSAWTSRAPGIGNLRPADSIDHPV